MGRNMKIINQLRKESFPEIKGYVTTVKIPFPIPGGMSLYLLPWFKIMLLTTKCDKLPRDVMIGLVAHELSHFSRFDKKGFWWFWSSILFPKKGEWKKEEKEADKLAIKKGYGDNLYLTKFEAERLLKGTKWEEYLGDYLSKDKLSKSYLSPKEVLSYNKKIKKKPMPKGPSKPIG